MERCAFFLAKSKGKKTSKLLLKEKKKKKRRNALKDVHENTHLKPKGRKRPFLHPEIIIK